jgi:NAD(P)H-dependent flavin oxidoreductase YrpB (nitropropane dioxygenase family)
MEKAVFSTPLTDLFGIKHPIMLAGLLVPAVCSHTGHSTGMNVAAGPKLAAAVTNAGKHPLVHFYSKALSFESFIQVASAL